MFSSQALLVVFSVLVDVLLRDLAKRLADLLDDLVSAFLAHTLDREIGVATCPIPVAISRLGLNAADDIVAFSHSEHNVPGHAKVITHLHATAWPDLVLPLAWHHFSICPCDLDACGEALHEVFICNNAANRVTCACRAIIWALRCWLAAIGIETERYIRDLSDPSWFHEGIFLLDSEPWVVCLVFFHDLSTRSPCVAYGGLAIPSIEHVAHD